MKVLQYESEPIPVSSAFSALNDEQDDEPSVVINKELRTGEKVIDYFDFE